MLHDLFTSLRDGVTSILSHSGPGILFGALLIVMPVLLGLLVTWGHRRAVLLSCALWYGGLSLAFLLIALTDSPGNGAYFSLIYGFFFSIVAVPLLALLIRVTLAVRRRFSTGRGTP
jgi:hypothetical protein